MRRHQWLHALMSVRPLLSPNFQTRAELFYAALARAGLSGSQLTAAVGTLTYYVQGFGTSIAARAGTKSAGKQVGEKAGKEVAKVAGGKP